MNATSKLKFKTAVLCIASTGLLAGCVHTPDLAPKPLQDLPSNFTASSEGSTAAEKWWLTFEDENLNVLIEQALAGNQQLLSTWSRLAQAQAMMDAANASWWPSLSGSFSAGRAKQSSMFPESNVITGSLQASYEIDLWGKLNNQRQAATMDLAASRDSLEATAMTLAAEVTDTWFGWVAQQAQLKLLQSQLETNTT